MSPLYRGFDLLFDFATTWGNRIKDTLRLFFNTLQPIHELANIVNQRIDERLEKLQLSSVPSEELSFVGVGYSGGFLPTMTALLEKAVDVISLVALGGATKIDLTHLDLFFNALISTIGWLSEELFSWIGEQWNSESNFLADLTENIGSVFNTIPVIGSIEDVINGALQILGDATVVSLETVRAVIDWILGFVSAGLEALPLDSIVGVPDFPVDSDTFLVNVYGEDDVLVKLGVSGKLNEFQGLTADKIFNIEIQSSFTQVTPNVLYPDGVMTLEADHYNYIRKDVIAVIHGKDVRQFVSPEEMEKIREQFVNDPQEAERIIDEIETKRMDWNLRVSDFVADFIANSRSEDSLLQFVARSIVNGTLQSPQNGVYEVTV